MTATQPCDFICLLQRLLNRAQVKIPVSARKVRVGDKPEAMAIDGELLHVAEHAGGGWQQCISGRHCRRGTEVEGSNWPAQCVLWLFIGLGGWL